MSVRVEISDEEILRDHVPSSQPQRDNTEEIAGVLEEQFKDEECFIGADLAVVPPGDRQYSFQYLSPDIMLIKGILLELEARRVISSWRMSQPNRPAPTVVFEISSKDTWPNDLDPKPQQYGELGVKEYFAFDPVGFWPNEPRLRGWRYDDHQPHPIEPNDDGQLWSEELQSWLVHEDFTIRFYDRQGRRRLSSIEAERQRTETERRRTEEKDRQIIVERQRAETERRRAEAEERRAEEERRRAEAERQRAKQATQQVERQQAELDQARQQIERQQAELARLLEQLKQQTPPDPKATN